jgi:hypothetical protein
MLCSWAMKYTHHQLEYEIDDRWLVEASVVGFKPKRDHYCARSNGDVFMVRIEIVEPMTERARLRGIFCDDRNSGASAKERVVRILQWLRDDCEVEPVKVVKSKLDEYEYKLVEGCHRFYCAHAMGFNSVPAVLGFDVSDPYA